MLFELRKLAGGLAMPLSVALVLLALGLVLLAFTRRQRLGRLSVLLGTALVVLAGSPWSAERLMAPLEQQYPVVTDLRPWVDPKDTDAATHWIVVLGGGHREHPDWPANARLSESSLARLSEGVRLYHEARRQGSAARLPDPASTAGLIPDPAGPDVRMFLAGAGGRTATADQMAATAEQWGVPAAHRVRARQARSTAQEAAAFRALLEQRAEARDEPLRETFHLVTSAFHMPRALAAFRAEGLDPRPAPAHFQVNPARGEQHIGHQLPQAGYLQMTERAWWEVLGRLWSGFRGPVEPPEEPVVPEDAAAAAPPPSEPRPAQPADPGAERPGRDDDAAGGAPGQAVAYREVTRGNYCGTPEAGVAWLSADEAREHGDACRASGDDAQSARCLRVSLGERPRGGHAVAVEAVRLEGPPGRSGAWRVEARERAPDPDAVTTTVITQPCAVVAVRPDAGAAASPADWGEPRLRLHTAGMAD